MDPILAAILIATLVIVIVPAALAIVVCIAFAADIRCDTERQV
jgi:hypothetical protein